VLISGVDIRLKAILQEVVTEFNSQIIENQKNV
jgi:hypothetical protein